jgi:hypothetical protein
MGLAVRKLKESVVIKQIDQLIVDLEGMREEVRMIEKKKNSSLKELIAFFKRFKSSTKDLSMQLQIFMGERS